MTRTDLAFAAAALVVLTSLTVVAGPGNSAIKSVNKLMKIGMAAARYQADHQNYLPLVMSPQPNPGQSWCSWSFGGKNCNSYWISNNGGLFDAQARYRPLNAYMYPGRVWKPALGSTSAGRRFEQAEEFRDPSDAASYQRFWPTPTTSITNYDDVGTSYQTNMAWFQQVAAETGGSFTQRFNEGTRRIAANERLLPSKFVWCADVYLDIVAHSTWTGTQFRNGWGDVNRSCMLYLDGHAAYQPTVPGAAIYTFNNANYHLQFNKR